MEFEWDGGNQTKSLIKHGTSKEETEQVFSHRYFLRIDEIHSQGEVRFKLVGITDVGKILFVIFTTRKEKIRIISARMASEKERRSYYEEKKAKENS